MWRGLPIRAPDGGPEHAAPQTGQTPAIAGRPARMCDLDCDRGDRRENARLGNTVEASPAAHRVMQRVHALHLMQQLLKSLPSPIIIDGTNSSSPAAGTLSAVLHVAAHLAAEPLGTPHTMQRDA